MTTQKLLALARTLAGPGANLSERAFAIAWRTVRRLERTAEVARRLRLEELDPLGAPDQSTPDRIMAAAVIQAAIRAPVRGEAATVAALEGAADLARTVAHHANLARVADAPKAPDSVLHDPRRLAALARTRAVALDRADAVIAANAGAEDAERARKTEQQRKRRMLRRAGVV